MREVSTCADSTGLERAVITCFIDFPTQTLSAKQDLQPVSTTWVAKKRSDQMWDWGAALSLVALEDEVRAGCGCLLFTIVGLTPLRNRTNLFLNPMLKSFCMIPGGAQIILEYAHFSTLLSHYVNGVRGDAKYRRQTVDVSSSAHAYSESCCGTHLYSPLGIRCMIL